MKRKKKRVFNAKKLLLVGIIIVLGIGILKIIPDSSIPHQNPVDTQISLYSERPITPNAVTTDPKFKHIAFAPVEPTKAPYLYNQIAGVIEAIKSFSIKLFKKTEKEQVRENGSWIWTPIMQMTPRYMESILSGAKENGVDTMYVSIDSYLDIFVMENGKEKTRREKAFSTILEDFIIRANSKGIAVDAEAGWQNWAEEGNAYKAFVIVDFVKRFNKEHNYKFRGFQYDVEPYLLDRYKKDPASVLKNFAELVDQTQNFIGADSLRFSVVIPDFYDKKDDMTPKFSYNGRKDYAFGHLVKILNKRPNSSIIVMSYRNFADGKDGSIEVSENEMKTIRGAGNTKIIIAQETGNFPPPYITFHNTSKEYLSEQVGKINDEFKSHSNFGGIAIHYINSYLRLE